MSTVFQPIIHLGSGEVVGFEALSRGPAGSSLESPQALLSAAQQAGRLGELDWVCRVQAMRAAAASNLHPSISWFINVEPAGLTLACPPRLVDELSRARADLRVILEVTERDEVGYVRKLLMASRQAREDAWGVAVDHVGTDDRSLAMLPLLHPDVVKLDMKVVRGNPDREIANVTAAVQAYAEGRGAVIIAEGIETKLHAELAGVFGAEYGQGFRYGKPGPLPGTIKPPRHVVPLRQRPQGSPSGTPFDVLNEHHVVRTAPKKLLAHIRDHLEAEAARDDEAAVVLASFEQRSSFTPARQALYADLARHNAFTVVAAVGAAPLAEPRYHVEALPVTDPMAREWDLIVLGVNYAAAFAARDLGDSCADDDRLFAFIYTHQRDDVIAAARRFVEQISP